jgi:uncharacterized protein (TIGR03086 family)
MDISTLERSCDVARGVITNVTPPTYDQPTPCVSWNVKEVLNHLVGATYWFADSMGQQEETSDHDAAAGGTDFTGTDVQASFNEGAKRAMEAFSSPGALEKMVSLPFGDMPGAAFLALAVNDVLTHSWDLAKATGQDTNLDPELATELLGMMQQSLPDQFRGPEGSGAPFGPAREAPAGASPADQLAAFLGREV